MIETCGGYKVQWMIMVESSDSSRDVDPAEQRSLLF